jgi:hypothetical protein
MVQFACGSRLFCWCLRASEVASVHFPNWAFEQVDILNARELKAYGNYYVVAKLDGLLCRTNYINQKTKQCPPDGTPPSRFCFCPLHTTLLCTRAVHAGLGLGLG